MIRIDMSEYMEKHAVARLIGAPPGYVGYEEGGSLTEAVRRRPYQVILFDEVEKAHPDVFNVLLQVLDDGRLTDGQGRTVDFRNTLIVLTSNLGATSSRQYAKARKPRRCANQVMDVVRGGFPAGIPEPARRDLSVPPPEASHMEASSTIQLKHLAEAPGRAQNYAGADRQALEWLAEAGYDPVYGARPLKRVIQRALQNPLAEKILKAEIAEGDAVKVSATGNDKLAILAAKGAKFRAPCQAAE